MQASLLRHEHGLAEGVRAACLHGLKLGWLAGLCWLEPLRLVLEVGRRVLRDAAQSTGLEVLLRLRSEASEASTSEVWL